MARNLMGACLAVRMSVCLPAGLYPGPKHAPHLEPLAPWDVSDTLGQQLQHTVAHNPISCECAAVVLCGRQSFMTARLLAVVGQHHDSNASIVNSAQCMGTASYC